MRPSAGAGEPHHEVRRHDREEDEDADRLVTGGEAGDTAPTPSARRGTPDGAPSAAAQVLTAIVQAAADDGTGAFVLPLRPDRIENVKKTIDKYGSQVRRLRRALPPPRRACRCSPLQPQPAHESLGCAHPRSPRLRRSPLARSRNVLQVDESVLATAYAWMRKASDDSLGEMARAPSRLARERFKAAPHRASGRPTPRVSLHALSGRISARATRCRFGSSRRCCRSGRRRS